MAEWITVKAAAQLRECSERNILDLIKRGTLEGKKDKDGRRWLALMDIPEETTGKTSEYSEGLPNISEVVTLLKAQLDENRTQLEEKDKQIERLQEELSQASERSDTIVLQLTRQIEHSQRLLEYKSEPWHRRIFRRKQEDNTQQ